MLSKIRAKLVLELRAEGLPGRTIAASRPMSRKSVTAVLEAADAAGRPHDRVAPKPSNTHRRYDSPRLSRLSDEIAVRIV